MQPKIADFLKYELKTLLQNERIRTALLNTNTNVTESETAEEKLGIFIEEAEITVGLLDLAKLDNEMQILEVGAGIGLSFIYLQKMGFNVTGIEPAADSVYSEYQHISHELFKVAKANTSQWHSLSIEESYKLNKKYDLIISNFVLEHVNDTESALLDLYKILEPSGKMIHNTVNYNVPFEPHLNIILLPFSAKQTERVLPYLKSNALWQTLNFISYSEVKKIAKKHQLDCTFEKHTSLSYLKRLVDDEEFRKRKKTIYRLFIALKKTHLIALAKLLPVRYNTPLTFSISKNQKVQIVHNN